MDPGHTLDSEKIEVMVREALRGLSPREEAVLRMRFGLGPTESDDLFLKGENK